MKKEKKASLIEMKHNEIKRNELKKITGGARRSGNKVMGCICVCTEGLENKTSSYTPDYLKW